MKKETREITESYIKKALSLQEELYKEAQEYFDDGDLDAEDARFMGTISRLCGFISALDKKIILKEKNDN